MQGTILSVVACALVFNIGATSALNCYVCNNATDAGCNANPIKPDPTPCTATAPAVAHCARLTGKQQLGGEVVSVLLRQCLPLSAETKVGCVKEFPGTTDAEFCVCKDDNCNGHGDIGGNNPAPQVIVAHFTLPLLGLALRQAFTLF